MDSSGKNGQRAEEALRQSEERYRLIVENVRDYAIFMLDPEGYIVTWNPGAERIKGYKADEVIGKHFAIFYPEEEASKGKPELELQTARRDGRFEEEGWRVRKDGTRFWAYVILTALYDRQGRLRGFGKITRDLTERRRADEQARQLDREQAARAQAEADARRKDEFLAMLAHELRNPLAPLLTGLALLRRSGDDAALRGRMIEMMDRQLHHMKRLVEGLLDMARIARDKIELQRTRLDLARVARQVVEDRRPALEQLGLRLEVSTSETPLWVWGDDTRLVQVLSNLLENAAKFSAAGDSIEVRVEADPERQQAVLSVRDHGVGIAPALLPQLFEAFIQANHTLDRTQGGLGLGLAVARGLVHLHGGQIEAFSAGEGQGAEFRVRLPLDAEPRPFTAPAAPPRCNAGKVLRIVVVEDNADAADSLKMLLREFGHEVRIASTGPEGVQEAADWKPDAVISDIGLPGMDGYGVASELRSNPLTARTRLIALTGYGSAEDRARGRKAGFDSYLVKPADPNQLQQALIGSSCNN